MSKSDLTHALAREQGVSSADAADKLDSTVNRLVRALRNGKPAKLPGIGVIEPGSKWTLRRNEPGSNIAVNREGSKGSSTKK